MRMLSYVKIFFALTLFLFSVNSTAMAAEVKFSWLLNQEQAVIGYKIYYGLSSGAYIDALEIVPSESNTKDNYIFTTITGLQNDQTYYFAVTAFSSDRESDYSQEVMAHITQPAVIPQGDWRLQYVDSEELFAEDGAAENAFDGDTNTIWHTEWSNTPTPPPHELQINLGAEYNLEGFRYLPRQDAWIYGTVGSYAFFVSKDGTNWGSPVAQGIFSAERTEKEVRFSKTTGQFVRFVALSEVNNLEYTSAAEINLLGEPCNQIVSTATAME